MQREETYDKHVPPFMPAAGHISHPTCGDDGSADSGGGVILVVCGCGGPALDLNPGPVHGPLPPLVQTKHLLVAMSVVLCVRSVCLSVCHRLHSLGPPVDRSL